MVPSKPNHANSDKADAWSKCISMCEESWALCTPHMHSKEPAAENWPWVQVQQERKQALGHLGYDPGTKKQLNEQ